MQINLDSKTDNELVKKWLLVGFANAKLGSQWKGVDLDTIQWSGTISLKQAKTPARDLDELIELSRKDSKVHIPSGWIDRFPKVWWDVLFGKMEQYEKNNALESIKTSWQCVQTTNPEALNCLMGILFKPKKLSLDISAFEQEMQCVLTRNVLLGLGGHLSQEQSAQTVLILPDPFKPEKTIELNTKQLLTLYLLASENSWVKEKNTEKELMQITVEPLPNSVLRWLKEMNWLLTHGRLPKTIKQKWLWGASSKKESLGELPARALIVRLHEKMEESGLSQRQGKQYQRMLTECLGASRYQSLMVEAMRELRLKPDRFAGWIARFELDSPKARKRDLEWAAEYVGTIEDWQKELNPYEAVQIKCAQVEGFKQAKDSVPYLKHLLDFQPEKGRDWVCVFVYNNQIEVLNKSLNDLSNIVGASLNESTRKAVLDYWVRLRQSEPQSLLDLKLLPSPSNVACNVTTMKQVWQDVFEKWINRLASASPSGNNPFEELVTWLAVVSQTEAQRNDVGNQRTAQWIKDTMVKPLRSRIENPKEQHRLQLIGLEKEVQQIVERFELLEAVDSKTSQQDEALTTRRLKL